MDIRPLSVELQLQAKNELNEDATRISDDIRHLKDWLKKQRHLNVKDDDQFLLVFLRGCKFSMQRTKEKIDNFYTMKTLLPEFCKDRDPLSSEIQNIVNLCFYLPLPKSATPTLPKIVWCSWRQIEQNNVPFVDVLKHFFMGLDIFMNEDDQFNISGVIFISDFKNVPLKYFLQFTPVLVKKCMDFIQSGYPVRIKGIYNINSPAVIETIYNTVAPYLRKKIKNRIHIYGEDKSHKLYDDIPQHLLPNEFGGNAGSVVKISGAWKHKIEGYRYWFKKDEEYVSSEELRQEKSKTASDVFGIEGSFRKLTYD